MFRYLRNSNWVLGKCISHLKEYLYNYKKEIDADMKMKKKLD